MLCVCTSTSCGLILINILICLIASSFKLQDTSNSTRAFVLQFSFSFSFLHFTSNFPYFFAQIFQIFYISFWFVVLETQICFQSMFSNFHFFLVVQVYVVSLPSLKLMCKSHLSGAHTVLVSVQKPSVFLKLSLSLPNEFDKLNFEVIYVYVTTL